MHLSPRPPCNTGRRVLGHDGHSAFSFARIGQCPPHKKRSGENNYVAFASEHSICVIYQLRSPVSNVRYSLDVHDMYAWVRRQEIPFFVFLSFSYFSPLLISLFNPSGNVDNAPSIPRFEGTLWSLRSALTQPRMNRPKFERLVVASSGPRVSAWSSCSDDRERLGPVILTFGLAS